MRARAGTASSGAGAAQRVARVRAERRCWRCCSVRAARRGPGRAAAVRGAEPGPASPAAPHAARLRLRSSAGERQCCCSAAAASGACCGRCSQRFRLAGWPPSRCRGGQLHLPGAAGRGGRCLRPGRSKGAFPRVLLLAHRIAYASLTPQRVRIAAVVEEARDVELPRDECRRARVAKPVDSAYDSDA